MPKQFAADKIPLGGRVLNIDPFSEWKQLKSM